MRLLLAVTLAGCGEVDNSNAIDAAVDAPIDVPDVDTPEPDAGVDASPPPPQRALELGAAGGRLRGGTYTFEVQLGHSLEQRAAQGATHRLEPNTAIKP